MVLFFAHFTFASTQHNIKLDLDYFNKNLDFVNYLEKINTSSIPEELRRISIAYTYHNKRVILGGKFTQESGQISRAVEPFKINNIFKDYQLNYSTSFWNGKREIKLTLGMIKQSDISLDCVQRSNILLGGNCSNADFKLLDGDAFSETGERRYLPVLNSSAESQYLKFGYGFNHIFSDIKLSLTTSLAIHRVSHDTYSPLFELTSDFLLNSAIKEKTLRTVINELQQELPQQTPWHDVVFGLQLDSFFRVMDGQVIASLGMLYSEKFDFEYEQKYKQNTYIKIGYSKMLMDKLSVNLSGTVYQHYLQGIQPILYTPKTAKFFAHPYGELHFSIDYKF